MNVISLGCLHRQIGVLSLLAARESKARDAGFAEAAGKMVADFLAALLKFLIPYRSCLTVAGIQAPEKKIAEVLGHMGQTEVILSYGATQATNLIDGSQRLSGGPARAASS